MAWYFMPKTSYKMFMWGIRKTKRGCSHSAITKIQTILVILLIALTTISSIYLFGPAHNVDAPFSLNIISRPASFGQVYYSIPQQRCLFLISIEENQTSIDPKPVTLSISSPDCVASIFPQTILPNQVAEVEITPNTANIGRNITITVLAERGGLKQTKTILIEVIDGEDTIQQDATNIRQKFAVWLSTNYPELDITIETEWIGTIVNPRILVVLHYMFLSENWEMYLTWHIMIPPYDWARIHLRNRFNQTSPTYAFEISSIQEQTQPKSIAVEDWV